MCNESLGKKASKTVTPTTEVISGIPSAVIEGMAMVVVVVGRDSANKRRRGMPITETRKERQRRLERQRNDETHTHYIYRESECVCVCDKQLQGSKTDHKCVDEQVAREVQ